MSAPASLGLLQAQVAEIRRKSKSGRPIGFHVSAPWTGPSTLRDGDEEVPVVFCPSPLAFRAELSRREREGGPLVLLTDRNDQELGADVLARLSRQRLHRLDSWQALRERLGVKTIDPRLRRSSWLPDHLLSLPAGTTEGLERPATQVLDAGEVWQKLLGRLGFASAQPDLRDLLEWTVFPERLRLFVALAPKPREAYTARLAESAGEAGSAVLHLVAAGRGEEAVAAGLVCDAIFREASAAGDAESAKAAGRFEALLLAGASLEPRAGREWGEAASALLEQRIAAGEAGAAGAWIEQAERLLRELKMEPLAARSHWLPSGFEQSLAGFAAAPGDPAAAERVLRHGLKPLRESEARAVLMLLRLSRYLLVRKDQPPAASFAAAAETYAGDGAFADLARTVLADTHHVPVLAAARDQILRAVSEQRQAENRRFAELLAGWVEAGSATETLVPVESVLDRVVAPLAARTPVLLLVLDGMSFAVFRELALDLQKRGWEELRPEGSTGRLCGIALLPTITEICRTSLFCGQRLRGTASTESTGFAQHPGLRQQGAPAQPPKLFHKGDLATTGQAGGSGLAQQVRDEVEKTERRVVAVVLNVVDDQLPKGSQLLPRWEIAAIRHLRELLQSAAAAGRAVVLTADHGHVLERETELHRREGGGARFRPAGPPPVEGEVEVRGARVMAGEEGAGLVLAWSERLRYSAIQSGYHGGASPQEVVVPLSVWMSNGSEITGWNPAPPDQPAWWWEEGVPATPAASSPPEVKPKPRRAKPAEPSAQTVLFGQPAAPVAGAWLTALFSSAVFDDQLRRGGSRQGLTQEQVAAVLTALDQRGGRMLLAALAHQLGLSAFRAQGLVAALQRVLNVEGFLVLSHDPVSDTVAFDRALLARQFPAGAP